MAACIGTTRLQALPTKAIYTPPTVG